MTAFVRNRYPLPSENVIANSCVFSHSTGHPHGMVYRRFEHGTVNTPCDEYGTVLASYYATTVCYRILLRHSCENGPPSITVCVAGWSCDTSNRRTHAYTDTHTHTHRHTHTHHTDANIHTHTHTSHTQTHTHTQHMLCACVCMCVHMAIHNIIHDHTMQWVAQLRALMHSDS